jgi:hypothetical protein
MRHNTLESDDNNETLDPCDTKMADNSIHDENETATEGKPLVRRKYRRVIEDNEMATAAPLDEDLLFAPLARSQSTPPMIFLVLSIL